MDNNARIQREMRKYKPVYKKDHPKFTKLSRYEYHKLTDSDEAIKPWPPVHDYDKLSDNDEILPHCKYIDTEYQRRIFPELHRPGSDDESTGWIPWYTGLNGNEFLVEVPASFINDNFNMADIYDIIEF